MPSAAELDAMRRAIALAAKESPHPNPRVGAVLLDARGEVIGQGGHEGPGRPHAERNALPPDSPVPPGASLVVTLEPCDHHGRTPPCTEAILAAGVRRVVVGATDPDPAVSGRGIERLRSAGVEVETGVLADEVEAMDPAYFLHRRMGRAHFTLKQATTLDGQTAAADGTSRWITGDEARADVHLLRSRVDAVMVGAGTLRNDDPRLDVRLPGYSGPQPIPIVVVGDREPPEDARLWKNPAALVFTARQLDLSVEVVQVPPDPEGKPDLRTVAAVLGERGILDVLVEGGARLAASLWEADLIDRGITYLAAAMAGGVGTPAFDRSWKTLAEARRVEIRSVTRIGADLRIDWRPNREGTSA